MKNVTDNYSGNQPGRTADFVALMPPELPPTNIRRWYPCRNAQVVAAVHAGALGVSEACRRYRLSPEEFREWERYYRVGDLGQPRLFEEQRSHALH